MQRDKPMSINSNGRYVDAPNSAAGTSDDSSPKWPPGSASPFAVVDALAGLVESVSQILALEEKLFAENDTTVFWWCDLGRWVDRATLALDSIRAPEEARHPTGGWFECEEVPAQGWFGVEWIDRDLLPLRTRLRVANEDADRIARALGSDLETVLERCFGMGEPVLRSLVRIVLRPFLRAFQGCAEGSEHELSALRESVWHYYGDDPSDYMIHRQEWLPDPAPEDPAESPELAAAPPSGNGRAAAMESAPDADDDVWISFAAAHEMTGLHNGQITRLCDSRRVRSKGKRKGRKVHSADLSRFMSERATSES